MAYTKKTTNISWYGNLNKLIALGVILSIPLILLGVWLWAQYPIIGIIILVVVGLLLIGFLSHLIRWTLKSLGRLCTRTPTCTKSISTAQKVQVLDYRLFHNLRSMWLLSQLFNHLNNKLKEIRRITVTSSVTAIAIYPSLREIVTPNIRISIPDAYIPAIIVAIPLLWLIVWLHISDFKLLKTNAKLQKELQQLARELEIEQEKKTASGKARDESPPDDAQRSCA